MNGLNLISSNQLIGELFSDFNISNTDWVVKAQRYMARGLSLMQIDGFYDIAYYYQQVNEFNAPLPCDNKYMLAVLHNTNGVVTRLPLDRSLALGNNFNTIAYSNIYKGRIINNTLRVNFEEGTVLYIYHRLPKDDDGNLLIPDNDFVLEALLYFVINKLSLSGYKHPVISRQEAEEKWNSLYPRARNVVNYPSLEEMDRFTKMNNNPLFMDILNEDWLINNDSWADGVNGVISNT